MPVIEYFNANEKYKNTIINGEQTIEQVAEEIQKFLN
jgi:adenylate kinase family enzyme